MARRLFSFHQSQGDKQLLIKLAYGKDGLPVNFPDDWDVTVIEPEYIPALPDQSAAIVEALRSPIESPPLRELVKRGDTVGIVFSDITRPTPNHIILPAVLQELSHIPDADITLFNALGTHRPQTEDELRTMLGEELVNRFRIVQNDAFDQTTQTCLGVSSFGNDIWVNRLFTECDAKILTGFIEPHFFAGFSGGGKAVMPGMGGKETIWRNHDYERMAHPKATWGITEGNPMWEEVQEAANILNPTMLVNVTLNKNKEITNVFAGNLNAAHREGCKFVKQTSMRAVAAPFDIVISTNSGHPLDLNLYQSVKGMSAAAQIVKEGGAIITAASCWDGIPEHGLYKELLYQAQRPEDILAEISQPGYLKQDQWQVQIQAKVQLKAEVFFYTDNLSDEELENCLLTPCHDIVATTAMLRERYGEEARICVLPEGPQTIPYIQK